MHGCTHESVGWQADGAHEASPPGETETGVSIYCSASLRLLCECLTGQARDAHKGRQAFRGADGRRSSSRRRAIAPAGARLAIWLLHLRPNRINELLTRGPNLRCEVAEEENARAHRDGAFMEPGRRNHWQSAASRPSAKAAQTSEIRCHRLPPVAETPNDKGRVDTTSLLKRGSFSSLRKEKRVPRTRSPPGLGRKANRLEVKFRRMAVSD